jgi:hypothetical protein
LEAVATAEPLFAPHAEASRMRIKIQLAKACRHEADFLGTPKSAGNGTQFPAE